MKTGRLLSADGFLLAPTAALTSNAWERLRGLLGRPRPAAGEVLLIAPCRAVHTVGMRYWLDLVFLDHDWRVARFVAAVPPGRFCVSGGRHARLVVEAAAGWIDPRRVSPGTPLQWRESAAG